MFLESFKSSASETVDALEDLRLDGGDGTSDEYDFMDDAPDGNGDAQTRSRQRTKQKYMEMLQEVADRKRGQVYIDLDDLDQVC